MASIEGLSQVVYVQKFARLPSLEVFDIIPLSIKKENAMRDYPARIWLYDGQIIDVTIRSGSLCAAMHEVERDYGWMGINNYQVALSHLS